MRALITSMRSELRLSRAREFLASLPRDGDALLLGPSFDTVAELMRGVGPSVFGWRRATLYRCALELARPVLVERGLTPVSSLALEALYARVTWNLADEGKLHRLAPLEGRPGLSRALAQTVGELRMLGDVPRDALEPALAVALEEYERLLSDKQLIDRAGVFALAARQVPSSKKAPLLLLDVTCEAGEAMRFAQALVQHADEVLVTAPAEDARFIDGIARSLGKSPQSAPLPGDAPERSLPLRSGGRSGGGQTSSQSAPLPASQGEGVLVPDGDDAVSRLQRNLFGGTPVEEGDAKLPFFSAPGEARECVEIARRVLERAKEGVRFDEVAVLLRSAEEYRAPLEAAFRRAGIPAYFTVGLPKPDPAGRALLALLCCAEENLSARRFSEYLSLAQVPQPDDAGAPPPPGPTFALPESGDALVPDEAPPPPPPVDEAADVESPSVLGQLRAPRRWEKLIIEAAVIGGADRWRRRLAGLRAARGKAQQAPAATDAQRERAARELEQLTSLEHFALPLLDALVALPKSATWRDWRETLAALATRALKFPWRVLSVLSELTPMDPVGPVTLTEVRAVLAERLSEFTQTPEGRRYGHVYVAPIEGARGLSFDTVFVPGLAERMFPKKLREDPLLGDAAREALHPSLDVARTRIARERHALQLAVGAARARVVLSYPRVDATDARPRVPSFYALEAARAVQGRLPDFEELQRQAESDSRVRLAWPAPEVPSRAIDDTEYDLAVLKEILSAGADVKGRGRYLVKANAHLARALRARYARWQTPALTVNDGFVKPGAAGRNALERHQLGARPFSPTALEQYAACPYRFFLSTLVRLSPLEIPGELEELGPLEKGSMAHDVQFRLLSRLRDEGVVVTPQTLELAKERLHEVVKEVADGVYDELKPAIERVWLDGVHVLEADLREWLKRVADDTDFKPAYFELSFGLPNRDGSERDPRSTDEPVTLPEGLQVRGSIDLVEQSPTGALRACDYKTGRARAEEGNVLGGGRHLQPLLYALVLEKLFPGSAVAGGRLFYTTQIGGYRSVMTPLEPFTREQFGFVTRTVRSALETGFFPAVPDEGECSYCDFRAVCGPAEEERLKKSKKAKNAELKVLNELRERG